MILHLTVTPSPPSCLSIRSHHCQGARLEIENLCPNNYEIVIQRVPITSQYSYLLFGLDSAGNVIQISNEVVLYPDKNEHISLVLHINGKAHQIEYVRTTAQCS